MTSENPCETTPKSGVSDQADRTAHQPKSPTISTPDAGKTDRTEREPSAKVGNDYELALMLAEALEETRDELLSMAHSEFDGVWNDEDFADLTRGADDALAAWNRLNGGSHD